MEHCLLAVIRPLQTRTWNSCDHLYRPFSPKQEHLMVGGELKLVRRMGWQKWGGDKRGNGSVLVRVLYRNRSTRMNINI